MYKIKIIEELSEYDLENKVNSFLEGMHDNQCNLVKIEFDRSQLLKPKAIIVYESPKQRRRER